MTVDSRKLKALRLTHKWSQKHLEMKCGLGQSHISRLERGERPNAHIATVSKLATALGVPVQELILTKGHQAITSPLVSIMMQYIPDATDEELDSIQAALIYTRHLRRQQRKQGKQAS